MHGGQLHCRFQWAPHEPHLVSKGESPPPPTPALLRCRGTFFPTLALWLRRLLPNAAGIHLRAESRGAFSQTGVFGSWAYCSVVLGTN